jgi:hypothetical protein
MEILLAGSPAAGTDVENRIVHGQAEYHLKSENKT